ncbi:MULTISPECIES: glycosyltransferase [unclassified Pseudonocardia]|uniref:glycosyltransferase n=1 Tax=unclassified Pseudonocardia TaxID=2619320 RepID=UPI0001FFF172|nr:glycosyltransferase [Pseudonocardia sp. Ae707_Ps1]OLM19895.1 Glycosyl transferase, group 2 family protein [Pseudonocardia sp. Ae707_Ps1]
MTPRPVTAAGVLIPAHDEAGSIGACVGSVLTALDRTPGLRARALCVVADRCSDATAARARAAAAGHPAARRVRVTVLERGPQAVRDGLPPVVGAARTLAGRTVLRSLGTDPATTWLLSTDADGTVAPGWVREHLAIADTGAGAVAGGVVLDLPGSPRPPGEPPAPDHPVYAANLGLRADAFLAVAGFPAVGSGEDHGIVARLRAHGFRVVPGAPGTVRTSARERGRARGGLADLLRDTGSESPEAGRPVA